MPTYGSAKGPVPLGTLITLLEEKVPKDRWGESVLVSSDEEGNSFGELWSVEITDKGRVILFPAGSEEYPE